MLLTLSFFRGCCFDPEPNIPPLGKCYKQGTKSLLNCFFFFLKVCKLKGLI